MQPRGRGHAPATTFAAARQRPAQRSPVRKIRIGTSTRRPSFQAAIRRGTAAAIMALSRRPCRRRAPRSPTPREATPCEFSISAPDPRCCPKTCCAGRGRNARLARQRHVGDGDEPSRQGVHRHRRPRPRPTCARCSRSPTTTRCCSCRAARSRENAIVPMNLLGGRTVADYVNTGEWSKKSIKEAKKYCTVNIAASSEDTDFTYVPAHGDLAARPRRRLRAHLHQRDDRRRRVPLDARHRRRAAGRRHVVAHPVAGRSTSSKYGVIYGGAQKNIGPAGLTLVIVRDDLLDRALPITPSAFHWKEQAAADSMVNTPPTYAIYIAGLVFEWLLAQGGVRGDRAEEHRQGDAPLRLSRHDAVLPQPGAQAGPLADERAVQAARRVARRRVPQGRQGSAGWCS